MRVSIALAVCFMVFALCPSLVPAETNTIHIPVTLDYAFLRSAFIRQAFNQPGEKAIPLNLNDGCARIELSDPDVGQEKSLLKLGSFMKIQAGLPLAGICVPLAAWEGNVNILQQLIVDPKTNRLGLQIKDFKALGPDRKETGIDKALADLVQAYLNPYLGKVSFDMGGAVKGLQGLLPFFVTDQDRQRFGSWLGTMRIGGVQMKEETVVLDVLMDVEGPADAREGAQSSLQGAALQELIKSWEDWDAFFVYQIQALTGQPVTEDERTLLLENLLDRRYEFVQALEEGTVTGDLVLRQFTGTWQALGSLFRKYLSTKLSRSPADYLTYIATIDALSSIGKERLGVSPGISHDGLLRLAKLLSAPGTEPVLTYSSEVNAGLRTFLGFGDIPDDPAPAYKGLEIDFSDEEVSRSFPSVLWSLIPLRVTPAYAQAQQPGLGEIKVWVLPKGDIRSYLDRVRMALEQATEETLKKKKLAGGYHNLYRSAVLATAWQESCWRQFVASGGKVRPIMSYNQSSVGLMQINERVWRGIYKPESLRWNIHYNSRAGCEILELYLRQYALKKPEAKTMDSDTLARALYAMYNGGPGQFKKFLSRREKGNFHKVDQLFWEKYSWTRSNRLDKVSVCLIGR